MENANVELVEIKDFISSFSSNRHRRYSVVSANSMAFGDKLPMVVRRPVSIFN